MFDCRLLTPLHFQHVARCIGLAPLLALAGCSDDDSPASDRANNTAKREEPTLYAVTTQKYSPGQNLAYVELVRDIDDTQDAFETTLEIPGYGLAVGPSRAGSLYVASDEAATVTHYEISKDGAFEKGEVVDFASRGLDVISAYAGQFQFVSPTKAYFFDSESLQAIIWNPQEMTVTGAVDLSELALADFSASFDGEPTTRDGELVIVTGYYDSEGSRVARETRVAFLDTDKDTIQVVSDARCGYITHSVKAANGDIYLASDTWAVAVHEATPADAPESCMLRINAGEHEIDPDYQVDLAALTDSAIAGSLLPGQNGKAYVRGFDKRLFEGDLRSYDEIWGAAAWRWYAIELGSDTPASMIESLPPGAPSSLQLPFEGRTFSNSSDADYRRSELLDMGAKDGPRQVGNVPGIPVGIVRLY